MAGDCRSRERRQAACRSGIDDAEIRLCWLATSSDGCVPGIWAAAKAQKTVSRRSGDAGFFMASTV